MKALWKWFRTLDRQAPLRALLLLAVAAWVVMKVHALTGYPEIPRPARIAALLCALLLLLASIALNRRDAIRRLRELWAAGRDTVPSLRELGAAGRDAVRGLRERAATMRGPGPEGPLHLAAAGAVLSAPVLAWWAVGDLSTVPVGTPFAYQIFGTWDFPEPLSLTIEIAASLAFVASVVTMLRARAAGRLRARAIGLLGLMCGAGLLLGTSARVMTARTLDANVGGGIAILGVVVVIIPLYLWAMVRAARWYRDRPDTPTGN